MSFLNIDSSVSSIGRCRYLNAPQFNYCVGCHYDKFTCDGAISFPAEVQYPSHYDHIEMSFGDVMKEYKDAVFDYLKDRGKVCIAVIEPLIPKPPLLLQHRARLIDILNDDKSGRFIVDDYEFSITNNATVRRADDMYYLDSDSDVVHGYRNAVETYLRAEGGAIALADVGMRLRRPEILQSMKLSKILLDDPIQRFAICYDDCKRKVVYLVPQRSPANHNPMGIHIAGRDQNDFIQRIKFERQPDAVVAPISHPPREVDYSAEVYKSRPREFTREENNYFRTLKKVNRPHAESSGDMGDTELAASRLREFILSLSKDSIIAKKNGDLRRFFIKYPEYEELIRINGGLKKFCSKKSHRKYVVWKDPADKTDQIGKIFVAMSSL